MEYVMEKIEKTTAHDILFLTSLPERLESWSVDRCTVIRAQNIEAMPQKASSVETSHEFACD